MDPALTKVEISRRIKAEAKEVTINRVNLTTKVATAEEKTVKAVTSREVSVAPTTIDTKTEVTVKTLPNGVKTKMKWSSL